MNSERVKFWSKISFVCRNIGFFFLTVTMGYLLVMHELSWTLLIGSLAIYVTGDFSAAKSRHLWWHMEKMRIRGHCVECDYFMAMAPSERCPECGTEKKTMEPTCQELFETVRYIDIA